MRASIVLFCLLVVPTISPLYADEPSHKTFHLRSLPASIVVDGAIDPVWHQVDSVSDFVQFQPYHGKDPSQRTVAKLFTNENAMYCLMVCYAAPSTVQQSTGTLDQFSGDVVSLMLDTYGDNRTAYKFAVSASGVRMDARLLEDARDRDYSWDGIWFASSHVYDWGFVVEMEIPYKSIKYAGDLGEWGIDFDRWIPDGGEDIYWCAYEKNEGQRISKFGKLVFDSFRPTAEGLNLEIYPVAIGKATYLREGTYTIEPDAGIDIFYNPSEKLTFQLTANPDFAQIEADPYEFNISRYEPYYRERRPFFTEGNEIFMASGKQQNSGFYSPLELLYSRRIGRKLPDGSEVPITLGTKGFGRLGEWEYGAFLALTGEQQYSTDAGIRTEPAAQFGSVRVRKQILGNSSIGVLFVGKHSPEGDNAVFDIDGAFRSSDWQIAYQVARSYRDGEGDFAGSIGMRASTADWLTSARGRFIGSRFDISDVGFVPWRGTADIVALSGPRWYMNDGPVREVGLYAGPLISYEELDSFVDRGALIGLNMQFRSNWGFEFNIDGLRAKDQGVTYDAYDVSTSAWFNIDPTWSSSAWFNYSRTYNFSRNFLAYFISGGGDVSWQAFNILEVGTSYNLFLEGNPDGAIADIVHNARPYLSITPLNYLNVRLYVDNVYARSSGRVERIIGGLLFSYNFLPKSWIYFAVNELRDRSDEFTPDGILLPNRLHVADRAGVVKVKYLYYF